MQWRASARSDREEGCAKVLRKTFGIVIAVAILTEVNAATHEKIREQCPTHDLESTEKLIQVAPSCQRAVAIFESCEFGSGGDVSLATMIIAKCERDFLSDIAPSRRRAYESRQERCMLKYKNKIGTMYRSFEAFCGAYVARDYSDSALKRVPKRK
jgi:hypothetical protein